ncbi:mechanosensitive ion channel domain-containing protein [Flavobacterium sp.]|uniref:mechanosensitive ion channel domain-containing protein n=1 Tax=Flavobacterium sp. TaxID=239 RepID=UPI000ED7A2AD|nr:mechanosensitive ion channel domain-containing protein [Flavobacterium sp.]HCQ13778.1 mechanosensitive ion channel protein MscS [Flavobacterium sp.]
MKTLDVQIIETVIVVFAYIVSYFITKITINNFLKNTQLQRGRRKIMIKAFNLIFLLAAVLLIGAIWGLKQNQIALFASTILTALGIAFFAQWSLLSNITSSIILFFNHPLKIGDTIEILDKEYSFEGEITDLTYFFLHLKLKNGKIITIPNSLLLQKSIAITQNK